MEASNKGYDVITSDGVEMYIPISEVRFLPLQIRTNIKFSYGGCVGERKPIKICVTSKGLEYTQYFGKHRKWPLEAFEYSAIIPNFEFNEAINYLLIKEQPPFSFEGVEYILSFKRSGNWPLKALVKSAIIPGLEFNKAIDYLLIPLIPITISINSLSEYLLERINSVKFFNIKIFSADRDTNDRCPTKGNSVCFYSTRVDVAKILNDPESPWNKGLIYKINPEFHNSTYIEISVSFTLDEVYKYFLDEVDKYFDYEADDRNTIENCVWKLDNGNYGTKGIDDNDPWETDGNDETEEIDDNDTWETDGNDTWWRTKSY